MKIAEHHQKRMEFICKLVNKKYENVLDIGAHQLEDAKTIASKIVKFAIRSNIFPYFFAPLFAFKVKKKGGTYDTID